MKPTSHQTAQMSVGKSRRLRLIHRVKSIVVGWSPVLAVLLAIGCHPNSNPNLVQVGPLDKSAIASVRSGTKGTLGLSSPGLWIVLKSRTESWEAQRALAAHGISSKASWLKNPPSAALYAYVGGDMTRPLSADERKIVGQIASSMRGTVHLSPHLEPVLGPDGRTPMVFGEVGILGDRDRAVSVTQAMDFPTHAQAEEASQYFVPPIQTSIRQESARWQLIARYRGSELLAGTTQMECDRVAKQFNGSVAWTSVHRARETKGGVP